MSRYIRPGVGQKPAIARRLIMTAVVQIENTPPLDMEDMIANAMGKP